MDVIFVKSLSAEGLQGKIILVGLLTVISVVTAFTLPTTITWDGYLYLGSGHALIHNEMASQYQWLRDPLYPLFIGWLSELNIPRAFTFIQAFLLSGGIYLLARCVFSKVGASRTILGTIFTYAFVYGFATAILQQSLIIFLSALLIHGIFAIKKLWLRIVLVSVSLILLSLTSTVVALGGLILTGAYLLLDSRLCWREKILSGIASALLVLIPFSVWTGLKSSFDGQPSNYPGQRYFWEMGDYNTFSLPDKLIAIPSVVGALNSFGVEFYYSDFFPAGAETRLFGLPNLMPEQVCGRLFPGPEEYIAKSNIYTPSYCVPETTLNVVSKFNSLLSLFLPIFSMAGFVILITKSIRYLFSRDFLIATSLLSGQLMLMPFWFGNVAISRLGLIGLIINLLALFLTVPSPKRLSLKLK